MADMHVLTGDGNKWQVVMHIAVPGGTNAVGIPWSIALVNSGLGGSTVLPDGDGNGGTISSAEKVAVLAGTVFEHSTSVLVESGGSDGPGIQATLRQMYASTKAGVQAAISRRLRYFGKTESAA